MEELQHHRRQLQSPRLEENALRVWHVAPRVSRAPFQSGGADPQKNVIFVSRAFYVVKTDVFGHVKMLAENVSMILRVLRLTFSTNIFA